MVEGIKFDIKPCNESTVYGVIKILDRGNKGIYFLCLDYESKTFRIIESNLCNYVMKKGRING